MCLQEDRTVSQLQSKYKTLKKQARKSNADMKRNLSETGNKQLRHSTVRELQNNVNLIALRKSMGPTATGFKSKHCCDAGTMFIPIKFVYLAFSYEYKIVCAL